MKNQIRDRWTAGRHAWLQQLAKMPNVKRIGRTGFDCMRLGWTEWVVDHEGGLKGERLTEAGKKTLESWNKS